MAVLSPVAKQQFSANGAPAAGYKLYTYATGTSTPQATYTDRAGTVAQANPVVLDADGYVPSGLYLSDGVVYDFVLKTAADVTVWTRAGVVGEAEGTFTAAGAGAVTRTQQAKSRERITVEDFGAAGDGTTLDDAAFAAAALLGKVIHLTPGATYYLSQRVAHVDGTRFICDGWCTVKLKTGTGGFNNVSLNADKDTNTVFYMSAKDDIGVEGVRFTVDGTKEVAIYPIRILGGCTGEGADVHRIRFVGLSLISGGYLTMASIGEDGVRFSDIVAEDCGSAQGNTYWTGTPQVTVVELDNDLVGGVHSDGNAIFGDGVGARNVLLTGQALTDYGQETDCVNIAGISGADRKGPVIRNIWADGVGEVLDCFGAYGDFHISRAKDVRKYVVKLIHGAHGNNVTVGPIESVGLAPVTFAGSASLAVHTANNTVRLSTVRGVGDVGDGPTSSEVTLVLVQENAGSLATCLPRNNIVEIADAIGGANCDYVVKDNCSVDNDNRNVVRFLKPPATYTAFGAITHNDNTRVEVMGRERVEVCLSADQTPLTTATDTTVAFAEVVTDRDSQHNTGTYKTRVKYPGRYNVRVSVRASLNAGDDVAVKVLKNAATVCETDTEPSSGTAIYTYSAEKVVEVTPDEAGTANADISGVVNITSAGTITLTDTNTQSFMEVTPL